MVTLRSTKGSPLTHQEMDDNFSGLDSGKLDQSQGWPTGTVSPETADIYARRLFTPENPFVRQVYTPTFANPLIIDLGDSFAKRDFVLTNPSSDFAIGAPVGTYRSIDLQDETVYDIWQSQFFFNLDVVMGSVNREITGWSTGNANKVFRRSPNDLNLTPGNGSITRLAFQFVPGTPAYCLVMRRGFVA